MRNAACVICIMLIINYKFVSFNDRYYAFSRKIASKKSFDDLDLIELLIETCVLGQRVDAAIATTRDVPFVGPNDLKPWMREESKLMIMTMIIKYIAKLGFVDSEGNPFA